MATVLVHGADLMFLSRIEVQLGARGHEVRRVREGSPPPSGDVAICDVERVDPAAAVALLRPAALLGFGSHMEPDAIRRARAAGFDKVVARSAIAERLPELVADLLAARPPTVTAHRRPTGSPE